MARAKMLKRLSSRVGSSLSYSTNATPKALKLGDKLKQTRVFTIDDVLDYSKVTHDLNPIHFDPNCAQKAGFEDPLVHGMLVASIFPRIISSNFPGAVYLSQSLQFKQPVYIGEEVSGEVEAYSMRDFKNKYLVKFYTRCFKQGSLVVLNGDATAILPNMQLE